MFTILDYNIADVDADLELDALVHRHRRILLGHVSLYLGDAAQNVHDTAGLDEKAVTRRFDELAREPGGSRLICSSPANARGYLSPLQTGATLQHFNTATLQRSPSRDS